MAQRIDFNAVKAAVSFEKVFDFLGLAMKPTNADQMRCACPVCQRAGDRAIVYTKSKARWYCHGLCRKGGDQVFMVAHVRGIGQIDAAKLLMDTFMREPPPPAKTKRSRKPKPTVAEPETIEWNIVDQLQMMGR